jgi:hypothetical protein
MQVIFSAADGIDMNFEFGCPVNNESVQFGFDAGYQQRGALVGGPNQMIVIPPKGHC